MGTYFFDQYSILHMASGIIAYFFGFELLHWIIIHVVFECVENTDTGIRIIDTYMKNIWPGGKKKQIHS